MSANVSKVDNLLPKNAQNFGLGCLNCCMAQMINIYEGVSLSLPKLIYTKIFEYIISTKVGLYKNI